MAQPHSHTPAYLCAGSVLFFVLSLTLAGCQSPSEQASSSPMVRLEGGTMGTFYEVTVPGLSQGKTAINLQRDIENLLDQINKQMSTYDPESEISRFNRLEDLGWFPVSPGFANVVQEALQIAEQTQGQFDPTVAPLVNLWHFGPEKAELKVPSQAAIDEALKNLGYKHLGVRLEPPAIKKEIPALQLDLSAIAKGYGVDQVGQLLDNAGYQNYLINIGGEIVARGVKPDGSFWRLAIERPTEDRQEIQEVMQLTDQALATSGDYRNFYEVAERRYSHTIDPQTGHPVEHLLHSVTLLAENCMRADALATAMMVMGPDEAWKFAQKHNLKVFLIFEEQGKAVIKHSADLPLMSKEDI